MKQYVMALGMFDGVHLGHLSLIKTASKMAQQLNMDTAVFTFSDHPLELLTGQKVGLLCTLSERQELLKKAGADMVAVESFADIRELTPEEFVAFLEKKYRVGGLVCGKDFRFGKGGKGDRKILQKLCAAKNIAFCEVDFVTDEQGEKISSSKVREWIKGAQIERVENALGRPFFFEGEVFHGKGLARQWKIPTINQKISQDLVELPLGVYQSRVVLGEKTYSAITNIGRRPTFDDGDFINAETHILEQVFSDIQQAKVELLRFVRPERKFESAEKLLAQIQKDIAFVKQLKD